MQIDPVFRQRAVILSTAHIPHIVIAVEIVSGLIFSTGKMNQHAIKTIQYICNVKTKPYLSIYD